MDLAGLAPRFRLSLICTVIGHQSRSSQLRSLMGLESVAEAFPNFSHFELCLWANLVKMKIWGSYSSLGLDSGNRLVKMEFINRV